MQTDEIIAIESAALDRWGNGDPSGFLEIYAPEVTYFDSGTERRIDGLDAMSEYYRPITGQINIREYEMISPTVQRHGDTAVLSYNLRSEAAQPDGSELTIRWNSTSVYARVGSAWRMIHSHWSLTNAPAARGIV